MLLAVIGQLLHAGVKEVPAGAERLFQLVLIKVVHENHLGLEEGVVVVEESVQEVRVAVVGSLGDVEDVEALVWAMDEVVEVILQLFGRDDDFRLEVSVKVIHYEHLELVGVLDSRKGNSDLLLFFQFLSLHQQHRHKYEGGDEQG